MLHCVCVCDYSTNMAISDAGKLGSAISKHEGNLEAALQEYQQQRIPQTAKEVICSRQTLPPSRPLPCLVLAPFPASFSPHVSRHIPHPLLLTSLSPHPS